MSYQVLARKWRPRSFQEMVGQASILRMLINALDQKRLHHAYLFTGTRGVGKTTLARLLAKCLNCESGITSTPCGQCHACQAIDTGRFLDLYEVDAASRTKVEDTRELLDNVAYPPNQGRFKIYLIDEVHMLSNHSFNALLKTLEEPPAHVKFLLATTEPKRLPVTILSRCLQFHLTQISPEEISAQLQHICKAEGISYEVSALAKIAEVATGSMRDALSLLDQAIAYGKNNITLVDIHTFLGNTALEDLIPLMQALARSDHQQVFACVAQLAKHAPDFNQVLETMISLFHKIALAQLIPDLPQEDKAILALGTDFSPEDVQLYYQIALLSRRDLALTPSPQQGFEMALLRMLSFKPALSTQLPPPMVQPKIQSQPAEASCKEKEQQPNQSGSVLPDWREILDKLGLEGMAYALAANCTLESITEHTVNLTLSVNHQPMLHQKLLDRIEEALSRYFKSAIKLAINLTTNELLTPHKQSHAEREQQLATAKTTLLQDAKVKKLLETYDATVEISLLS